MTPTATLRTACRAAAAAAAACAAIAGALAAETAAELAPCSLGLRVPLVSPLNYSAKIVAVDKAKGSYQVKSESDGLLDWVPAYKLRRSCKGEEAAPVSTSYFFGRWSLFIGPTAHHEVIGGKGYIVVGTGARVPPLQIHADGRYQWTLDSNTSVSGKWRALQASELPSGTPPPAIVLINAEGGHNWAVWKSGLNPGSNLDAIGIRRTDLGLSYQGTRLP